MTHFVIMLTMLNRRLEHFKTLKTHAWYSKLFKKLNTNDIEFCESFLKDRGEMSVNEFEMEVNRLFLTGDKPKRHLEINELLLCCI